MMIVNFFERGNNTTGRIQPPVKLDVQKYSNRAVGGPYRATIRATGNPTDLLQLLDWLMVKVEIHSEGRPVWWGHIYRVEVEYGKVRIMADLGMMSNRIAVAYTETSVGVGSVGARKTTAWVEDANSINTFGYKELLLSYSDVSTTGAEKARDRALSDLKLAQAGFVPGPKTDTYSATIECRGWWDTLEWRYAPVPTLLALAYETTGPEVMRFGNGSVEQVAQAFDVASSINVQQIGVFVAKVGNPLDNLKVAICQNPDDINPGSELASQVIAGADLGLAGTWVTLTLDTPYVTTGGTSYFLVLSRSGAQDGASYYATASDPLQGYGAGPFVRYTGGAWAAYAGDIPFRIYDNTTVETSQQVKNLITNFGQFLRRVFIANPSGISEESYRDGDATAKYEIEKLMEVGTNNGRRILARVDSSRSVEVYEQVASTDHPHYINARGEIFDPYGSPLNKDTCPAGIWISPKDILPVGALNYVGGLQAFFIEEMEYSVASDTLNYQAANLPDPWNVGGMRDG